MLQQFRLVKIDVIFQVLTSFRPHLAHVPYFTYSYFMKSAKESFLYKRTFLCMRYDSMVGQKIKWRRSKNTKHAYFTNYAGNMSVWDKVDKVVIRNSFCNIFAYFFRKKSCFLFLWFLYVSWWVYAVQYISGKAL